jgi:two-component system cell cycle response regulator
MADPSDFDDVSADFLSLPPTRRWMGVALRRLTGALVGLAGLMVGMAGFVVEQAALGAVAGVLALLAGLIAHSAETRTEISVAGAEAMRAELDATRAEAVTAREELSEVRRQHGNAQQTLADLLASQPPAGSFDRKLDSTAAPTASAGNGHSQTDTRLLADPETNLFSEAYFRVALDARIASARRHLRPVAVALLEVAEGSGGVGAQPADPIKVTGSIRQTLRDADTACRMSDGCFAVILEDTPENGAVWTVERIRRNLTSRHGMHTLWAGVACYPAHAFSTDELLDQASLALDAAREWKQDRIEVATAD